MKRLNNNEFIEKCIKKHGNLYDYSLCVYENTRSKVKIICNNHGEFELQASNHLHQNQGCVECVREKHKFIKMSNYQIESLKKILLFIMLSVISLPNSSTFAPAGLFFCKSI